MDMLTTSVGLPMHDTAIDRACIADINSFTIRQYTRGRMLHLLLGP